jgi:hypothetical protein
MNWIQTCPWAPALILGLLGMYVVLSGIAALLDDYDLRRDQRYQARHPSKGDWK